MNPNPQNQPPSPLKAAIANLTIVDLWRHFRLRGTPGRGITCSSPFRSDQDPSFAISLNGKVWYDHGTSECGGLVEFVQKATKFPRARAREWLIKFWQGCGRVAGTPTAQVPDQKPKAKEPEPLPQLPYLERGTADELASLAALRGLGVRALEMAMDRGFLWFTEYYDYRAWLVTDQACRNAQLRRLDGGPWASGSKVQGITNNEPGWPIGIIEAARLPVIALCEGTPDLLAAFEIMMREGRDDVAPICITGAANLIHPDALPCFVGKRVRIFPHDDDNQVGIKAAAQWAKQLQQAGAIVDCFSFAGLVRPDGQPVKDLNDFCLMNPAGQCNAPAMTSILPRI